MQKMNPAVSGKPGLSQPLKKCSIVCIAGAAATALLFIGAAMLISKIDVQKSALAPIATSVASLSSGVTAFIAAKIRKAKGLLTGCTVGLAVFVIVLVAFLLTSDDALSIQALYKLIAFVSAGGVGGIAGVSSANKVKKPPFKGI